VLNTSIYVPSNLGLSGHNNPVAACPGGGEVECAAAEDQGEDKVTCGGHC